MTEKEERLDEELDKTAEETAETTESSNESTETEAQTPQPEEEAVEKSELELLQEKNNARKILAKNCCQQSTIWNERWQQMSIKTKLRI